MNFEYINLSDIAYEQIEGNFWYGCYGVFRVVMMKGCGFINATRLCSDGNKELKHWYENQVVRSFYSVWHRNWVKMIGLDQFLCAKLSKHSIKLTLKKQFQVRTTIHSSFHTLLAGFHQILQSASAKL